MYCFVIFKKGLRSVFDESSQTAWLFCTTSNIYRIYSNQFTQNLNKLFTSNLRKNHSIYWWKPHENPCSSFRVFREQTDRQTDRRGGGLCFIICIDVKINIVKPCFGSGSVPFVNLKKVANTIIKVKSSNGVTSLTVVTVQ